MQLRTWTAVCIFVGSYLPLSIILLAQDFNYAYLGTPLCLDFWSVKSKCVVPFGNPRLSITIFIACFACLLFTLLVLKATRTKHSIKIVSAVHQPSELMNYTLPYVVSFMGVGYNETGKFVGVVIFLSWLFWITHKSGQIILNPVLTTFGWRLYEVEYSFSAGNEIFKSPALINGDLDESSTARHSYIQNIMIIRLTPNGEQV